MAVQTIDIRPLRTHAELTACVELQRDTWGRSFSDIVPASILQVSQRVGGVAAGAFLADGSLVGFVYGITGWEAGRPVHWSDMLAVRPEVRNLGVGRRLKEYQRDAVRGLGAKVIYWTFDPLVSRNAHLNFNVFGVRVVEYVEDMYGETDSDLHRGIGTDRFIVAWPTEDADIEARLEETRKTRDRGLATRESSVVPGEMLRVEIPGDIAVLQTADPAGALEWRRTTRAAIQSAMARGYQVNGFYVDEPADRGYYLLTRSGT